MLFSNKLCRYKITLCTNEHLSVPRFKTRFVLDLTNAQYKKYGFHNNTHTYICLLWVRTYYCIVTKHKPILNRHIRNTNKNVRYGSLCNISNTGCTMIVSDLTFQIDTLIGLCKICIFSFWLQIDIMTWYVLVQE